MYREAVENLLAAATDLLGLQVAAGSVIREQSKERYGQLLESHIQVVGAIGSAVKRRDGERAEIVGDSQQQIVLIASFIQGINIVECAISEGYYIQAAALIRQELETIAALEELKKGTRVLRRTPNVGHVPWALATLYGDLSKAAHAADHDVLQDILAPNAVGLAEDTTGVVMVQQFRDQLSWRLYGLHVALLILLAVHLHEHQETVHGEGQGLNEIEIQAVQNAQQIMIDGGWLVLQP
ncbi:hypothetical protein [Thioalkalivibrio thiocyanodenitrificans]|uniref:hypothetical protein n=1 Tax=Thioalkalivibrio thiocyanodenitrificans TaxID=243063 RepID=UPI000362ED63|nr:hypothetical protein [Thioalkalivibrio thiocyanodenitrificans]